jgi:CspA family cold shock protein
MFAEVKMSKQLGTVKWFNDAKGFGFIRSDEAEYFVHYSEIRGSGYRKLDEGQEVTFEPNQGDRGAFAKNVEVVQ